MKDYSYLISYYESRNEEDRLSSRAGQVEYLTTMEYILKYAASGMSILDIGAGTGRYSFALADKGMQVDAVELVDHNIKIFRKKMSSYPSVTVRQGNALMLSDFDDESYDIVLLLGPMYHLFSQSDQIQALSEALRVTKRGGVIFSAYCIADASILCSGFVSGNIGRFLDQNMLNPSTFQTHSEESDIFQLYRKEDIDALMQNFPVKRLHYVASDLSANYIREVLETMDDETFRLYFQYHLFLCERADMVGATHHSLDIFQKL